MISDLTNNKIFTSERSTIYRICFYATMVMLAYLLATMAILFLFGGIPEHVQQVFDMLQENLLIGLLRLELLSILFMPLYFVIFYGVYHALKNTAPILVGLPVLLIFAGVILFLATPSTFSWLALHQQYAAATTNLEKEQLLAAGASIMASDVWHGSGARVGGLLMQTGTFWISFLMLKSTTFHKSTAIVGILMHGLDLIHIIVGVFFPAVGNILMMAAGPLYLVWFPLLARDFLRLAKFENEITE